VPLVYALLVVAFVPDNLLHGCNSLIGEVFVLEHCNQLAFTLSHLPPYPTPPQPTTKSKNKGGNSLKANSSNVLPNVSGKKNHTNTTSYANHAQ